MPAGALQAAAPASYGAFPGLVAAAYPGYNGQAYNQLAAYSHLAAYGGQAAYGISAGSPGALGSIAGVPGMLAAGNFGVPEPAGCMAAAGGATGVSSSAYGPAIVAPLAVGFTPY